MPRIQVQLPETFIYTTEIVVRASDLNYGNHVGHDSILTLMQEARINFYRSIGFKDELSFEGPVGQIIADAALQYKSESFLGDALTVKIFIDDVTKYGFDMLYQIENTLTGKEVARGKTGIVCFNYDLKKVATIPEALARHLRS